MFLKIKLNLNKKKKTNNMEDNELTINAELFNNDLDDLGFDAEITKSDNDNEAKELFGY